MTRIRNFYQLTLFLLLIAGCAAPMTRPNQDPVTSTFQPALQASPMKTAIKPSQEPSPTMTINMADLFTPTPQPTISAEGAKSTIFTLLSNNDSCQLPCLWGIMPGESDNTKLESFLTQFGIVQSPDIYVNRADFEESGILSFIYRENSVHIDVDLYFIKNEKRNGINLLGLRGHAMQERGKDLDWLSPDVSPLYGDTLFNQTFEYYLLPQMLSVYGKPSQVLLAPKPDDPDPQDIEWYPFSVVLFYPDRGIFVEYVSPRETKESSYLGCPAKAEISLAVWDPKTGLSLKNIIQYAGVEINEFNLDYFKPIEEATSMSLDEFYQKFKDSANTGCLETPKEIW